MVTPSGREPRFARPGPALLALVLAACAGATTTSTANPREGAPEADCTFTNPVGPGQDPWVVRRDDSYYLVASRGGGIWVSGSAKLPRVKDDPVKVWTAPSTGWNRSNVWAPELHYLDGHWYIYYAAGESGPPFIHQRAGVLESEGDDPRGAYVDRGMLYTGDNIAGKTDNKWAIDLTVARIGDQLYAVWSGWDENRATDRTPQNLYIARMSNPWTISSDRVKISAPVESWERGTELDLNEGPEFLFHDDDVFIIYSTRESWLPAYRLGQLRLRGPDADPMDPASWVKSGPVFIGTDLVYGVGHASFTTSPDGTEDWIVYHSKRAVSPGWDRVINMQSFGWNPDGSPDFGTPVPPGQPIPVPSGQCGEG